MKRITRTAISPHSAHQLYALVQEVEAYPRFLPWCVDTRVLERTETSTRATITAGMGRVRQSFTTQNDNRPGEAIDMRLVEGPFKAFAAAWRFTPLGEGACKIDFSLEYEFASGIVGRVLEPLFERIANTMVDAFVRRAEEVHGTRG
jgi:ribosome-associated toxin RatA of RatAB toxin-antitoxin module